MPRNSYPLFDPIWDVLFPSEQARVIQLLVERIDHDARRGQARNRVRVVGITFSRVRSSAKDAVCASS